MSLTFFESLNSPLLLLSKIASDFGLNTLKIKYHFSQGSRILQKVLDGMTLGTAESSMLLAGVAQW